MSDYRILSLPKNAQFFRTVRGDFQKTNNGAIFNTVRIALFESITVNISYFNSTVRAKNIRAENGQFLSEVR